MPRSVKGKDDIAVFNLRIRKGDLDRLHEIAAREHRIASQEVRRLIQWRIAQADAEDAETAA